MSTLTTEQRSRLRDAPSWIAHASNGGAAALDRIDAILETCGAPVVEHLVERLLVDPDRARVELQGLALARSAGFLPSEPLGDHLVLSRDDGQRFVLASLFHAQRTWPAGHPDDVARLTDALDRTFQGRRYALYLRRAVPAGFQPTPVSRAVHLWLNAIDRGEWKGRHAIYEDDDVALELTLVQQPSDTAGGRVLAVGPIDALERLRAVDGEVVDLAGQLKLSDPGLPLIVALGAQPRWRLPRGYVEQLLYGTADRTEAANGPSGPTYRATFRASERSLFSDPAVSNLAAFWWIEGRDHDPFAFGAWSHDNPWSDAVDTIPDVAITRFLAAEVTGERKTLSWYPREEADWRGA